MNLRDWFEPSFSGRAKEIGLEWDGTEYTFAELDARSNRLRRERGGIWGFVTEHKADRHDDADHWHNKRKHYHRN